MAIFRILLDGKLIETKEFKTLRSCNAWVSKNCPEPDLIWVACPQDDFDKCVEYSQERFKFRHRLYPDLYPRPEWDAVTPEETQMRAEQAIIRAAKERSGENVSICVGAGKWYVTLVHYDKPMKDRVEYLTEGLTKEEAYEFVKNYKA